MAEPARSNPERLATAKDLLALPPDVSAEIIGGVIVEKAMPSFDHGRSQGCVREHIGPFDRRPGGRSPGGWWIGLEVDVEYEAHEVYRHDLVGWRRERVPEPPRERPVGVRPDWACEVLSPSNWANDTVKKFQTLQRCGVPHYWLVDLEHRYLTIYRLVDSGLYAVAALAQPGQRMRLEPFDAIEIEVGVLFGDDPAED